MNFGRAIQKNPAYLEIKRIEYAREIARLLGQGRNKLYLDSDTLLLNLQKPITSELKTGTAER